MAGWRPIGRAAALAVGLGGCMATGPYRVPAAGDNAVVYVAARGWHTDVALPASELGAEWAPLTRSLPGLRVLSFGFGERAYLLADRATMGGHALGVAAQPQCAAGDRAAGLARGSVRG